MNLHIFDLDKTFILSNISFQFGKFLFKKKKLKLSSSLALSTSYALHSLGFCSIKTLHLKALKHFFLLQSKLEIDALVQEFLPQVNLNPLIYARFKNAQERGDLTALLSSSPDFLVLPFGKMWGFPIAKGTPYLVDKDMKICDIPHVMEGEAKAFCVQEWAVYYGVQKTIFYTDSLLDLDVLKAVDTKIVVNPSHKLKKMAQKERWEIIDESSLSGNCQCSNNKN